MISLLTGQLQHVAVITVIPIVAVEFSFFLVKFDEILYLNRSLVASIHFFRTILLGFGSDEMMAGFTVPHGTTVGALKERQHLCWPREEVWGRCGSMAGSMAGCSEQDREQWDVYLHWIWCPDFVNGPIA